MTTLFSEPSPGATPAPRGFFTRNTLLPFHPGAMRWYANKATAGMLYGD